MARSTVPYKKEGGFVDFGGILIDLLSQLARIARSQSVLSIHSGGEVPGVFRVEGIADDDFSSSIRTTLLEVVTLGDLVIVVAGPAGLLGTVRCFTLHSEGLPVESSQDNLFMQRDLGNNRGGVEQTAKKRH